MEEVQEMQEREDMQRVRKTYVGSVAGLCLNRRAGGYSL